MSRAEVIKNNKTYSLSVGEGFSYCIVFGGYLILGAIAGVIAGEAIDMLDGGEDDIKPAKSTVIGAAGAAFLLVFMLGRGRR